MKRCGLTNLLGWPSGLQLRPAGVRVTETKTMLTSKAALKKKARDVKAAEDEAKAKKMRAMRKALAESFRDRRAADEAAEKQRMLSNTMELIAREEERKRLHKAASVMQSFFRAALVKLNQIPRLHSHLITWRSWSLRRAFRLYVDRQNVIESQKERIFSCKYRNYIETRRRLENLSASQLGHLLDEAGISRDDLGPILDFDSSSLEQARAVYINQHLLVIAERECRDSGFSFKEAMYAYQSGSSDVFHYFQNELSFPYFVLFLRDMQLLQNEVSLKWIQDCYEQNGVRGDSRGGQDYIQAFYSFKQFIENRCEMAYAISEERRQARQELQQAQAKLNALQETVRAAQEAVVKLNDLESDEGPRKTKENSDNASGDSIEAMEAREKQKIDMVFKKLRSARRNAGEAKMVLLDCEATYKRLMRGADEEEPPRKPSPEKIVEMIRQNFGCNIDLTMEAIGLVEEASQVRHGGVTEGAFASWCVQNDVLRSMRELIDQARNFRINARKDQSDAIEEPPPIISTDVTKQQISSILEQHSGVKLHYVGFESAVMSISLRHREHTLRYSQGQMEIANQINTHDSRKWKREYGSWFIKGGLFRLARFSKSPPQGEDSKERTKMSPSEESPIVNEQRLRQLHGALKASDEPTMDSDSSDSTDEDESPEDMKSKHHIKNELLRLRFAPILRAIEYTNVCSASSTLGNCILQPSRFLGWLLRYEKNLRQIFMMYSQPKVDLNENEKSMVVKSRPKWRDAINNEYHMSYVDFLRFCRDFELFPQCLSNDQNKDGGFQLLDLFMSSKQDTRSNAKHMCDFTLLVQPGSDIQPTITHARYCNICGSKEYVLSSIVKKKIENCLKQLMAATNLKQFWSTPLDQIMEYRIMLPIGDDPTAAEIFTATRHVRREFEQLRVLSLEKVERDKVKREILAIKERKQKKIEKERKATEARIAKEASERAKEEGASLSFRRMKEMQRRAQAMKERQNQLLSEAKKNKARQKEDSDSGEGKQADKEDMLKEEVSEEEELKFSAELEEAQDNFRNAISVGVQRGMEMKARIRTKQLNFQEFLHLLVLCANAAFGKPKSKTWNEPMRALFKVLDPGFARTFGRSLHMELAESGKVDRDLPAYEKRFHWQLIKIYEHWTRGGELDMTGLLFVKMLRLTGLTSISDASAFAAYEISQSMNKNEFIIAVESLLWRGFVEGGNNPSSWLAPVSRASAMTNRGLALRRCVERISCFGLYAPGQALHPAWKILGGRAGSSELDPVEKQMSLAKLYVSAAASVLEADHDASMQACAQLSAAVAEHKSTMRVSKWRKLRAAHAVSSAAGQRKVPRKSAKQSTSSSNSDIVTNSDTFLTSTVDSSRRAIVSQAGSHSSVGPRPPSKHRKLRDGKNFTSPLVRKRRPRRKKKVTTKTSSKNAGEKLISTHDAYFHVAMISEHLHPDLHRTLTPNKRRGRGKRVAASKTL